MGKLDGKVAIVTGASRGIGEAAARLFAAEGAKVVVAARTAKEGDHPFLPGSLATTVADIQKAGGIAMGFPLNLASEEECVKMVEATQKAYGPVDILVNNAAVDFHFPIKDYPVRRWMTGFAVDLHAPFILSQKVLPDMIAKGKGAIINVSSGSAIGPGRGPYKEPGRIGLTLYGVVKAGLERLTQGLAMEVYQYGITVAAVSPSQGVATPGSVYQGTLKGPDDPRGEPVEYMAKAILLLATEPLDKVTGRVTYDQQILVEFGWLEKGKGTGIDRPGSGYSRQ